MKLQAQLQLRCRQHEAVDGSCTACQRLAKCELQYQRLRRDRDQLLAELRKRLASQELIIIDIC